MEALFAQQSRVADVLSSEFHAKVRQAALAKAAEDAGRNTDQVKLLAVSKKKPVADIQTAYASGQRAFGENYLQEALQKMQGNGIDLRILSVLATFQLYSRSEMTYRLIIELVVTDQITHDSIACEPQASAAKLRDHDGGENMCFGQLPKIFIKGNQMRHPSLRRQTMCRSIYHFQFIHHKL